MLVVRRRSTAARPADATVVLAFAARQQTRLSTHATTGEAVGILLPRGTLLVDGDRLEADDGRVVAVVAATEALAEVTSAEARDLARAAYHLGNRHVPVEVTAGRLRFARDPVLAALLAGLGFTVVDVDAPFHPEPGAYAGGAASHAHSRRAGVFHGPHGVGRIHDHHGDDRETA